MMGIVCLEMGLGLGRGWKEVADVLNGHFKETARTAL